MGARNLRSSYGLIKLSQRLVAAISSLFVLVSILLCQNPTQVPRYDVPSYSSNAITVYHWDDKVKTAASPDGKKKVSIEILDDNAEDFPAKVTVDTEQGQLSATIHFGLDTEVLWSPDSRAFALTGSCCGAGGQYETDVFYVYKKRLVRVELTTLMERAFGHPVRCSWPESPNVAAVKWLIASKELLVAAEIMHHSNCDSFGTFKAYVVDLAGHRVVKVLNQLETKRLYHDDLGEELLQSDDVCIRHPESCHVGSYHQ
jgi:hypothetical protein